MKIAFLSAVLALIVAAAAHAQSPGSVVTPSTTSESVRSTTDALSGAARDKLRQEETKAKAEAEEAKAKAEKAGRTVAPVEKQPLPPKR